MEHINRLLTENLNEHLLRIVISGRRHGGQPDKVKIRPVCMKGELFFQTAVSDGKKEFHTNYTAEEMQERIEVWLVQDYKQLLMDTETISVQALVNKKGKAAIHVKQAEQPGRAASLEHNRKKEGVLEEGKPVPFLVDLGVQTPEGKIVNARYHKFRQINRFLEFIEDVLPALEEGRELTVIDFGCGKSYLTFAMYHYLHELKGRRVRMIGLDLKKDVIEECSRLAKKYGYEDLTFLTGDIASYKGCTQADMVVTLHACDTATDFALQKAVQWNAKVILSVPCCQHELNGQIQSSLMQPVLKYGLVKERIAALLTDAFRADMLEEQGYQVQLLEFIDMEHTPKNILIRAVKAKNRQKKESDALTKCMEAWNAKPLLAGLLERGAEEE